VNEKDLSIVIVNHNAKNYLKNSVESIIKNLTGVRYEIIVIDNASVDGSAAMMRQFFPQAKTISAPRNLGFARANNLGIKEATGKYILLLNNDMVVIDGAINKLLEFINSNSKIGIATGKLIEENGKVQRNCRSFPITPFDAIFGRASLLSKLFPWNPITRRNTLSDINKSAPSAVDWVSGACMLVRREVFEKVGLLDEAFFMYWEDADLCVRTEAAGWEVRFNPDAEFIHFTGRGGGKRSLKLKLFTMYQMHRSAYWYFRKHYYKTLIHPMAAVAYLGMVFLITGKVGIEIISHIFLKITKPFINGGANA
jgi:GT2 family glycosyltransferase